MSFQIRRKVLALSMSAMIASSTIISSGVASAQEVNIASVQSVTATPTASAVFVNGEQLAFHAYNINSNNYFKLRDIAYALNDTEKSFSVGWDGEINAISLESGKPYQAVGGEMVAPTDPKAERGVISTSIFYLDGKVVDLTAYTINGNNYFKLRDLAAALDFGVTWDGSLNTIRIDSNQGYVAEGGTVTPSVQEEVVKEEEPKQEEQGDKQYVNAILVDFGRHNYATKSQTEYDKVMELVYEKVEDTGSVRFEGGGRYEQYYYEFISGKRWDGDLGNRSLENRALKAAEDTIGAMVFNGVSEDVILKAYKASTIAGSLTKGLNNPRTGAPRSAYDALFRGISDCDSDAQVYSAVFDAMGFNTAILGYPDHAQMMVEIDGNWYTVGGLSFNHVKELPTTRSKTANYHWFAAPTYGTISSTGVYTR